MNSNALFCYKFVHVNKQLPCETSAWSQTWDPYLITVLFVVILSCVLEGTDDVRDVGAERDDVLCIRSYEVGTDSLVRLVLQHNGA